MSDATDLAALNAEIQKLALEPIEISGDSGTMKRRKMAELTAERDRLERKIAMNASGGGVIPGFRFGRLKPPGGDGTQP